jgi:hypothetical protein
MGISRTRQNHTPYTLARSLFPASKKGVIEFLFSKLAFLIFGIIISGAFFYFLFVQQNMQQLNELARTANSISNVVGMVYASPFNMSMDYNTRISGTLSFANNIFTLSSGNRSINYSLLFIPTSGSYSTNFSFDNCLHIEKRGNNVTISGGLKSCQ